MTPARAELFIVLGGQESPAPFSERFCLHPGGHDGQACWHPPLFSGFLSCHAPHAAARAVPGPHHVVSAESGLGNPDCRESQAVRYLWAPCPLTGKPTLCYRATQQCVRQAGVVCACHPDDTEKSPEGGDQMASFPCIVQQPGQREAFSGRLLLKIKASTHRGPKGSS